MPNLNVILTINREPVPLCIEDTAPEFSWYLQAEDRGCRQDAYQCTVQTAAGDLLWDSGRVSDSAMKVRYRGNSLPAETTCTAMLTVWDNLGRCASASLTFRTGLREHRFDGPGWDGAKWIGTGVRNLWAPALFVYEISCDISGSGGIRFGGNDPRLMDRAMNPMGTEAAPGESYLCAVLSEAHQTVELYRVGYVAGDCADHPLYTLPIPEALQNRKSHTLRLRIVYGEADVLLDEVQLNVAAQDNPFDSGTLNLNPAGRGGDFPCFPALAEIGVCGTGQFSNLTVRNYRIPGNILAQFSSVSPDQGLFDPSHSGIPLLRREFCAQKPARAYLTITARGIYEAYLNGRKVGQDYLAPGLTQYTKTHMYQVYDVTQLISEGQNAWSIALGEGWWSGSISFRGANWNYFGDVQSVIAKLVLEMPDGSREVLTTSPDTFQCCWDGPIRYASLFQGQVYDSSYEKNVAGWLLPGANLNWTPAVKIPLSAETAALGILPAFPAPQQMQHEADVCTGQLGGGVRCIARLTPQSVREVRPGVFLYDFGQNIAGIPEIQFPGANTTVTLRYAEVLYPDLPEYSGKQGMLMTENLRGALVTDVVKLGTAPMTFCPQFTFHGFRYLELSGLDQPPESVLALALSSVTELTADYHCSDPGVNRLFRNICWSLRDNFLSIPTDCPQRNERMGWSGDLSVFSRTAVYLTDADAFLRRHMIAMRDLQDDEGMFPAIAPIGSGGFGGLLWGSAGITVPWEVYQQYGDTELLETHYPAMVRYTEYLLAHVDENGLQTAGELGDWLSPQNGKTESKLLWMAYFVYDLSIMAQTARILGKPEAETYARLWKRARQRLGQVYFDPETGLSVYSSEDAAHGNRMPFEPVDPSKPLPPKAPGGGYRMDTQSSYCVPLALDALPDQQIAPVCGHLTDACCREQTTDDGILCPPYSLMTGFIGTAWILPALTMAGRDDIAYRMLQNHSYPSWLYPVDQGATTIWERLDSYTADRGFGGHNSMNSFNHYSFGAVGQWLLSRSLGIERDEPGFRHFVLSPMPDQTHGLTEASGWCLTPSGRIESSWKQIPGGMEYTVVVPANTDCLLKLPGGPSARILESGMELSSVPEITVLKCRETYHPLRLESGKYCFTVLE